MAMVRREVWSAVVVRNPKALIMAAPSPLDPPGQPRPLSGQERAILARIDQDLSADDPALAERMAAAVPASAGVGHFPGQIVLIVVMGLTVVVTIALTPIAWRAILILLIVMVVVPLILVLLTERHGRNWFG
jgi:hypothetical protein